MIEFSKDIDHDAAMKAAVKKREHAAHADYENHQVSVAVKDTSDKTNMKIKYDKSMELGNFSDSKAKSAELTK